MGELSWFNLGRRHLEKTKIAMDCTLHLPEAAFHYKRGLFLQCSVNNCLADVAEHAPTHVVRQEECQASFCVVRAPLEIEGGGRLKLKRRYLSRLSRRVTVHVNKVCDCGDECSVVLINLQGGKGHVGERVKSKLQLSEEIASDSEEEKRCNVMFFGTVLYLC